jgi:hypothetical protein
MVARWPLAATADGPLLRAPLEQLDLDVRRPTQRTMAQEPLGDRVELAAVTNQVPA